MADKKTAKTVEVKTVEQLQEELVNPHILTVQRKGIARAHTAITAAQLASTLKEEK